ncbi:MAG: hypothetical protein OXB95_07535 [Rhodobacteraceae bacterium]|nr:hypothetical protein [Paracoccaceae bacterium]
MSGVRFLDEHRIGDKWVLRLFVKWLNAGFMEGVEWSDSGVGISKSAMVSPALANVLLHCFVDLWFHKRWRECLPKASRQASRISIRCR